MTYDLIVRGGTLIDGSGLPGFRADIAVAEGRIASIGRISERADEEIDAEGHVVAPGFIDLHTHMDAQVFWDPLGTSSCYHGVTSVVMGNCGFTLAPSRAGARELAVRNLERAEDIAPEAMNAGVDWSFETFREYIETLERLPKGINYAACLGHSALRTYVMGERAFEGSATDDDLKAMRAELRDGLRAGAVGFTTSRTHNHQTADDRPVASRLADWDEVCALLDVLREENTGVFELANEDVLGDQIPPYIDRLVDLAVRCGRPITYGIGSSRRLPGAFRVWTDGLERIARAGGRAFGLVHARPFNLVLGFRTHLPFDALPVWREVRALPLEQQAAALRDPVTRQRLVEVAKHGPYGEAIGAEARKPDYDWVFPFLDPLAQGPSVAQIAAQRGADADETFLDLALESELEGMFLQPFANEDPDHVLELMRNPRTVVTFSDSGAHVSQIMDSSIPTHVLAHWTREQEALTLEEAVRMLSFEPASAWGFADRGLLREGLVADLVVFDPARVGPRMPEVVADLPGGCQRLVQRANGFAASIVGGRTILRNGEPTGAHPGQVLRTGASR
jgi:N-acyl-D-aspartate/D-glutamate deacylase